MQRATLGPMEWVMGVVMAAGGSVTAKRSGARQQQSRRGARMAAQSAALNFGGGAERAGAQTSERQPPHGTSSSGGRLWRQCVVDAYTDNRDTASAWQRKHRHWTVVVVWGRAVPVQAFGQGNMHSYACLPFKRP